MAFAYTNQTNFRPFSYQEMLAPVLMATQAQQEIENAYGELDSQAAAVGALANEADDPVTYGKYKAFEDNLRAQADTLAKQGLTPSSRKALMDARRYYANQITPIQNAVTRRRALADEQRKALLSNPTLMFQRNFNTRSYDTSLDRFLENPDYDYGNSYSGELLTQQVSKAASNLAQELTKYGKGKKLDAYTNTFLQKYGYSKEQVLDAMYNPNSPLANKVLNSIVDNVITSSKIPTWADKDTLKEAYGHARRGLWSAIGPDKISTYDDYGAKIRAQEASQRRLQKEQTPPQVNGIAANPIPIFSQKELDGKQKKFLSNVDTYKKYFYRDAQGNMKLTVAGYNEYNRKVPKGTLIASQEQLPYLAANYSSTGKTPFREFMDSLGAKFNGFGPNQSKTAGKLWAKYLDNSPESDALKYDATKFTEYSYPVGQSLEEQRSMKARILTAARNSDKIYEVDFDPKTSSWKNTGKSITKEELNSEDYTIVDRRPSQIGYSNSPSSPASTILIKDKEGNVKRYRTALGINPVAEYNRNTALENAGYAQQKLLDPTLSDADRAAWENFYKEQIQTTYLNESQLDVNNKTKPQEFNPYAD